MIRQLMQRDPAWRYVWYLTAAAVLARVAFVVPILLGPVYVILWSRVMPHRRASFFEAALPVAARDLYLARLLSLLSMIWLPGAMAALSLLMGGKSATARVAAVVMFLTLITVVNLSVRIEEFAAPPRVTMLCAVAAALIIVPTMLLGHPGAVAAICAAAAAGVGGYAWRSIPATFQSAPMDAAAAQRRTGRAAAALPWWPILRSLFPWQVAVFIPISFIWLTTGQWIWAPTYLMMAYGQVRLSTRWTQALPMSRSTLLAASMVPFLLVLAGAAEIGMLTGAAAKSSDLVRQGDPNHFRATGTPDVFVSPAFWQRARGGVPPAIEAPWGETFPPEPISVFGLTFYNPYAVGVHNSERFEEWQFARATERIYGRALSPRQLAETKPGTLRPIVLTPRMQVLTIAALLIMALFWVWLIEFCGWHRIGRLSKAARNTLGFGSFGSITLFLLALELGWGGRPSGMGRAGLEGLLLLASNYLPANPALLAACAAVPVALAFRLAMWQADAAEIPESVAQAQQASWWTR